MKTTPRNSKTVAAATFAVIITLASAGTAVAVNLGAANSADTSPTGRLAATQPISLNESTAPQKLTPSTSYLDVDAPITPDPSSPMSSDSGASSASSSQDDAYGNSGHSRDHKEGINDDD